MRVAETDLFRTEFLEERVMFLGGNRGGAVGAGGAGVDAGAEVRGKRPPAAAAPAASSTTNHHLYITRARYSRHDTRDIRSTYCHDSD